MKAVLVAKGTMNNLLLEKQASFLASPSTGAGHSLREGYQM